MLKASDFRAIHCVASALGWELTANRGKLAARLLERYADRIDEVTDLGFARRKHSMTDEFELLLGTLGLVSVRQAAASISCECPVEREGSKDWLPAAVRGATDLLCEILAFQKQRPRALWFELTYLLWEVETTTTLVEHLGLVHTLGGLFAASTEFEIRGDTQLELPGLFPVTCELSAGVQVDFRPREDVGVSLKYRTRDNLVREGAPVDYTPELIARFFATAPQAMHDQLAQLFPGGEVP